MEELYDELDSQGRELALAHSQLKEIRAEVVALRWREQTSLRQKRNLPSGSGDRGHAGEISENVPSKDVQRGGGDGGAVIAVTEEDLSLIHI